jgi:hypothetical protein
MKSIFKSTLVCLSTVIVRDSDRNNIYFFFQSYFEYVENKT